MTHEVTLEYRIRRYFTQRPDLWINGGDIEELAMTAGYKASNASRRLRELAEENFLDRELRKGKRIKSVYYKLHEAF